MFMSFKLDYLAEPKLQFGQYFEHEDTKTGLAEFGPFGKNIEGLHPSEIKLGFIGTGETISGAKEWIEQCQRAIESENSKTIKRSKIDASSMFNDDDKEDPKQIRLEKILNRDFVGFNQESKFECSFQMNERWDKRILPKELNSIMEIKDKEERIWELVDLFDSQIESLAKTGPSPKIIILALTPEIIEEAHAVQISGNFYLNFRRAIKARAMKWGIPIQLLQRRTVEGTGGSLQEVATRAWNFCTAQYYKADGIPWRPVTLEKDVCFIGISFYVAKDINEKLTMRSSVAQAFDYLGQGLVLRGDPFKWDAEKLGRSPHLSQAASRKLIKQTLEEYIKVGGIPPRRVVIHKTSEYWGKEHEQHNELDGFYEGIEDVFPRCETDFVALRQTGLRLFREGRYPPLRGTYLSIENSQHFLYTMGFIPYLETYPGSYVPEPWQITEHHGGSAPKDIFREILALTKMNVNNCSFADGTPITISFSQMIGEIMKHIPKGGEVQPKYQFYM
jgi:hypothetical protein